jgi:XTP/dITP diphosphohydrolase
MRYVLASNNRAKLAELSAILSETGAELISQSEAGLLMEVEETGGSFEANAYLKAKAACEALGEPAIADDSGLMVDALDGAPGVYSARYGGLAADAQRVELLLRNMEGVTDRRARFVCCIACVFPNGDVLVSRGECEGLVALTPRGNDGFGYDPVFELPELGKTMAELTQKEKNAVSHRGAALRIFQEELRKYNADK